MGRRYQVGKSRCPLLDRCAALGGGDLMGGDGVGVFAPGVPSARWADGIGVGVVRPMARRRRILLKHQSLEILDGRAHNSGFSARESSDETAVGVVIHAD